MVKKIEIVIFSKTQAHAQPSEDLSAAEAHPLSPGTPDAQQVPRRTRHEIAAGLSGQRRHHV